MGYVHSGEVAAIEGQIQKATPCSGHDDYQGCGREMALVDAVAG